MNAKILLMMLMIALLASGSVMAEVPEGETVKTLPWNIIIDGQAGGIPISPHVKTEVEESSDPDNTLAFPLKITYDGTTELQLKLLPSYHDWQRFNESFANVVTHHFAIVGEVRYEKVSPGSYLEMWSHFASPAPGYPEPAYFTRTLADSGPMGKLEGTHDWREFQLPFDATGTKSKLARLEMNLHLTGPGTVHLRNMKLVQYPDAPVSPSPSTLMPQGQTIAKLSWTDSSISGPFETLIRKNGEPDVLKIEKTETNSIGSLWRIDDPKITAAHYAVTGEVRYEGISNGYLEMANVFSPTDPGGPPSCFITKTTSDQGPMGRLRGTTDWRPFWLPFDSSGAPSRLTGLVVDCDLADKGVVYLRNLRLVQYPGITETWGSREWTSGVDREINTHVPLEQYPVAASSGAGETPKVADKIKRIMVKIAVGADQETSYSVDGTDYASPEAMQQYLTAQHQVDQRIAVVIRGDKNVPYADIARILEASKNAGIQSVYLASTSDPAAQIRSPSGSAPIPVAIAASPSGIDWKSFLLGVAATGIFLLATGGSLFLFRRLSRRRHERELRRIASMDG